MRYALPNQQYISAQFEIVVTAQAGLITARRVIIPQVLIGFPQGPVVYFLQ